MSVIQIVLNAFIRALLISQFSEHIKSMKLFISFLVLFSFIMFFFFLPLGFHSYSYLVSLFFLWSMQFLFHFPGCLSSYHFCKLSSIISDIMILSFVLFLCFRILFFIYFEPHELVIVILWWPFKDLWWWSAEYIKFIQVYGHIVQKYLLVCLVRSERTDGSWHIVPPFMLVSF